MSNPRLSVYGKYEQACARIRELEAENARLNMEMAAYRQGCTKEDAAAMQAVMRALEDEKIARAADAKDGSAVDRGGEHG